MSWPTMTSGAPSATGVMKAIEGTRGHRASGPIPSIGWIAGALALVVGGLLAAGCGGDAETAAPRDVAEVSARLGTAERIEAAERIELAGAVEAERMATVSARVMGAVTAVAVELGDTVRTGQTLISIDPAAADGQTATAAGALAQARAGLALAEKNHERFRALAETGAASALELDGARTAAEQARGAVAAAEGAVRAASSVARDARVVAPFAGRVAARHVEVGDLAAPGRPLVTIESTNGRRAVLAVPESLVASQAGTGLAPGTAVPIRVDARPDLGEVVGRVAEISPGPDPAAHAYTVKVDLPSGVDVPAGAAVRAMLPGFSRSAVVVPAEAVLEQGGLSLVVVRDGKGQAESRVVSVGAARGDGQARTVEILSGLVGGEEVLLGLAAAPPAGAPVRAAQTEVKP